MKINNIHFPMKTKDFTTNGLVEDVQNDSGIVFEFLTDITETSPELDEKIDEIVIQKKRELTEKRE